jgi:hypothetical protein
MKAFTEFGETYISSGAGGGTIKDFKKFKLKPKFGGGFRISFGKTYFF